MNKAQAIHNFWSSFNLYAIDEQSAYDTKKEIPAKYIAYELRTANMGESVALTASLYYRTNSWDEIQQKADEIADYIGWGGKVIPIDNGYIWVKLAVPFAQRLDAGKDSYRRIVLNITADFLSAT